MKVPHLLAWLELEEARQANSRAARLRVDKAQEAHAQRAAELEQLERRRSTPAPAVDAARESLNAARLELTRARRALIGTI